MPKAGSMDNLRSCVLRRQGWREPQSRRRRPRRPPRLPGRPHRCLPRRGPSSFRGIASPGKRNGQDPAVGVCLFPIAGHALGRRRALVPRRLDGVCEDDQHDGRPQPFSRAVSKTSSSWFRWTCALSPIAPPPPRWGLDSAYGERKSEHQRSIGGVLQLPSNASLSRSALDRGRAQGATRAGVPRPKRACVIRIGERSPSRLRFPV
jgi:hypothetical protein